MSPMCLLTMPVEVLQMAARHSGLASPHGERLERLRTHQLMMMLALTILPLVAFATLH